MRHRTAFGRILTAIRRNRWHSIEPNNIDFVFVRIFKMKFILTIVAAMFLAICGARAQILTTNSYFQSIGGGIPDQNPNGTNSTINVGGIVGTIQDIRVFLDITNGFNGDLYGYLAGPNGGFAVLLNRV